MIRIEKRRCSDLTTQFQVSPSHAPYRRDGVSTAVQKECADYCRLYR